MDLEERIGYQFTDQQLFKQSLTHPSITLSKRGQSYERLEFLGDSVLGMIVADLLFHEFPDEQEGSLAKRRSALVCREGLARVARMVDLGQYIHMSSGEETHGGRENDANLENAFEALIAGLYLDGGIKAAREFVEAYFVPLIRMMGEPPKDPKTTLQEWAQQNSKPLPEYRVLERTGPAHSPEFHIEVSVTGFPAAEALGKAKKFAERDAAKKLLEIIEATEAQK